MIDVSYQNALAMIDRLMTIEKLSTEQESSLESLVQLVERYEAEHHPMEIVG